MTNEELVIKIQDGDASLYAQLWDKNKKLIFRIMKSKIYNTQLPRYISIEDLEQEMYFALCKAVNYYDREKPYSFNSYLNYPILTVLKSLVFNDKSAVTEDSYNTEIVSDNGKSVEKWELVNDPESEKVFYNIEIEDMQSTVRQAVAALKERERAAISLHYFHNRTFDDIGAIFHVNRSRANQIVNNALKSLRRNPVISRIGRELYLHLNNKEVPYSIYAAQWEYSFDCLAAEIELSNLVQSGKCLSYGRQKAFMQIAKDRYIGVKIREAHEIQQAVCNRLIP